LVEKEQLYLKSTKKLVKHISIK